MNLGYFSWIPATTTALSTCLTGGPPNACGALGKNYPEAVAGAAAAAPPGPALILQNEYSPALLLPSGAGWTAAATPGESKTYRDRPYVSLKNPIAHGALKDSPAGREAWARFVLPGGQVVVGGEAVVFDVIDVAAGVKPALVTARPELRPLLARFGYEGGAVDYSFTLQAQQQGVEKGLDAILGSWPVRTALGPLRSYRGRATRFDRDGARCRVTYGVQLSSALAARVLSGAIHTSLVAGTFAGWPLSPEYLSDWKSRREDELVVTTLELTKAGCDAWQNQ